jgi:hypothetical protein
MAHYFEIEAEKKQSTKSYRNDHYPEDISKPWGFRGNFNLRHSPSCLQSGPRGKARCAAARPNTDPKKDLPAHFSGSAVPPLKRLGRG